MHARVKLPDRFMSRLIDGKFVRARVDAQLQILRQAVGFYCACNGREVLVELLAELRNVTYVIYALVKPPGELGRDGLDGNFFIRDGREDDEQLHRRLGQISLIHRDLRYKASRALALQ